MDTVTHLENVTVIMMPALLGMDDRPVVIVITPIRAWVRSVVIVTLEKMQH